VAGVTTTDVEAAEATATATMIVDTAVVTMHRAPTATAMTATEIVVETVEEIVAEIAAVEVVATEVTIVHRAVHLLRQATVAVVILLRHATTMIVPVATIKRRKR